MAIQFTSTCCFVLSVNYNLVSNIHVRNKNGCIPNLEKNRHVRGAYDSTRYEYISNNNNVN